MTLFIFANNVNTTLAGGISSGASSLTLSSSAGLPASIPAGYLLVITLNDQATRAVYEVIYASAVSGATLSGLSRGQEGTSALAWLANDFAYSGPTAGQMNNLAQLPLLRTGDWATVVTTISGTPATITASNEGSYYEFAGVSVSTPFPTTGLSLGAVFGGLAISNSQTLTLAGGVEWGGPQGTFAVTPGIIVIPAYAEFKATWDGYNYFITVIPSGVIATAASVATAVGAETSRAEGVETTLAAAIGAETSRAEGVETTLAAAIGVNVTTSVASVTVPAGVGHINIIRATAAGGGGGFGTLQGGSGGGGGNAVIGQVFAVTAGHTITITPGTAGTAGTGTGAGGTGGNTTVVDTTTSTTLLTLNGGVGGGDSAGTPGAAGSGGGGLPGLLGHTISTWAFPGAGGGSLFGSGGSAGPSSGGYPGQAASGYGGGGSGGGGNNSGGTNNGGAGSGGMVEWQWEL